MATQRLLAVSTTGEFVEVVTVATGGTAAQAGAVPVTGPNGTFDPSLVGTAGLPAVTTADNGDILQVVNGVWAKYVSPYQGPIQASWSQPIN